ncbi:MAG: cysteine synthase A [Bacilli bacterium]|nr:cysteine synthase A [Bacilli bacterium]
MKIGNTPLKELKEIERHFHLKAKLFAKYEKYNPAGSVKDRIALAMIEDAEERGLLKPGSTIIESTSGNTGIGLAYVGKEKGYRVVLTMPESMSIERRNILKSYGAELVLTEASKGMKGAIAKAKELNEEIKDSIILGQFDNPANPEAHYRTTGPEIYSQTNGEVVAFVAGVGTGGTVSGVGRYLKEQNKNICVVAVEPLSSPMISKGEAGPHQIQGIGAGFIPNTLDRSVIDEVITVSNDEAFESGRLVNELEKDGVGISSGAALCAAIRLASKEEYNNKVIVVLFPDGIDRYLSTRLCKKEG